MIDLNRLIGLVYNCNDKNKLSQFKDMLVDLAVKMEVDDMVIIGENVYKGPGEVTYGVSGNLLFSGLDFTRALRDSVQTIGTTECECDKMVFILSDDFDESFNFQFNKLIGLASRRYYETKYYIFNFGNAKLPAYKDVDIFESKDLSQIKDKLLAIFDEYNKVDVCEIGEQ